MTDEEADDLLHTWELWARANQLEPEVPYTTWLILAGRGFGKTRTGAETVIKWVRSGQCSRLALVAEDSADARDVMVEGESGILACSPRDFEPKYEPSKRRLTWPNGAVATLFSAEDYDSLRGPQFDGAWCDELCFVAGTLVETSRGRVPIEKVRPGDMVWTREGLKRVSRSGLTNPSAELWSNGHVIGTAGHPIWTTSGYRRLIDLLNGDTIAVWQSLFYITNGNTGVGAGSIRTVRGDSCLESCGKIPLGQSRTATTFTTLTKTPIITSSTTLSSLLGKNISYDTSLGVLLGRTRNGEETILESLCGESGSRSSFDVLNAAISSSPPECEQSSAIPIVKLEVIDGVEKLDYKAPVYSIEVENCPEYFANGILVHNCKWRYAQEAWDNLQFGLRLGDHPKQIVTTTPRPIKILKDIILRSDTYITKGNTRENLINLAPPFVTAVVNKYEGTRLGRQELDAELLDDVPGALWSRDMLDRQRLRPLDPANPIILPDFKRVVVSVDPPTTSGEGAAEAGIIVAAIDTNGHGYVLEDVSLIGSPDEWSRVAVKAYDEWEADMMIYEANQGGEMVAALLRGAAKALRDEKKRNADFVPLKAVHATRGKYVRAEPVSQLYEQDKVSHVGFFPELEDQMCEYTPDGNMGYSPDRMDSLVWAFTELLIGATANEGLMDYYRQEAETIGRRLKGEREPSLPGTFVSLQAPEGINTAFGREGDKYLIDAEGLFNVKEQDVKPLESAGFRRFLSSSKPNDQGARS